VIVLLRGVLGLISCGGREIRTLGGFNPTAVFKTAALGHYASPPCRAAYRQPPSSRDNRIRHTQLKNAGSMNRTSQASACHSGDGQRSVLLEHCLLADPEHEDCHDRRNKQVKQAPTRTPACTPG